MPVSLHDVSSSFPRKTNAETEPGDMGRQTVADNRHRRLRNLRQDHGDLFSEPVDQSRAVCTSSPSFMFRGTRSAPSRDTIGFVTANSQSVNSVTRAARTPISLSNGIDHLFL